MSDPEIKFNHPNSDASNFIDGTNPNARDKAPGKAHDLRSDRPPLPGSVSSVRRVNPMVCEELLQRARTETHALIRRAESHYGISVPTVEIHFDLRGTAAGMVLFPHGKAPVIRYNSILLQHNRHDFLTQTLPHEVAHLIARTLHGKSIRPHGHEWKTVMLFFGADTLRCHNYATDDVPVRKLRRFPYTCGCQQHQLTTIRHNRILKGLTYRCRQCGEPLRSVKL
jgi:SprT protein